MAIEHDNEESGGTEVAGPDFLNMSDEDLMNFDPASLVSAPADNTAVEADKDNADADTKTGDDADKSDDADDKQDDDAGDGKDTGDEDDKADDSKADVASGTADASGKAVKDATGADGKAAPAKADAGKQEVKEDDAAKSGTEGAKDESAVIDYEAEYKKLTAPFKANGKDITVKSADDAIALMQMGANYNKKMAALKPNLKLMKMLEQADLLDEGKLSFLIDLDKKDPAAINKLVMDSKLDPLDLSAEKAGTYKPGDHSVDDRTMELDAVINELEGSAHYDRTLKVVSTEWDRASKGVVAEHPQILKVINGHMESGIYDRIVAEMSNERTFGRLKGLSDLEAYRQVGDAIESRGGFADLGHQAKAAPAEKVIVQPKPKKADEDKLKEQKRAASATKTSVPGKAMPADFNPLSLSDADFAKFNPN